MPDYLETVRELPRPSEQQISNFIDYVAAAHSWYKHLPLLPPGIDFYFFFDPNSGCDLVIESGNAHYRERKKHGFHYSAIPTAEYRNRFGYLEYFSSAGTTVLASDPESVVATTPSRAQVRWPQGGDVDELLDSIEQAEAAGPRILTQDQHWVALPQEILVASRVQLTAVIYPAFSGVSVWRWAATRLPGTDRSALGWPEETGGPDALLKILDIVKSNPQGTFKEVSGKPVFEFHPEIHSLVDAERRRQKTLVREAIQRVIRLLHS
jgi:hypothetical protein